LKDYIKYIIHKYYPLDNHNTFIHVGKCAGSTLEKILMSKLKISRTYHMRKPIFNRKSNYYIVLRNPISRAISAFNWRKRLVLQEKTQINRFQYEYDTLKKYKSLNQIAELLYDSNQTNSNKLLEFERIHHIKKGINYYLSFLIKKNRLKYLKKVFVQETLNEDIKSFFDINMDNRKKYKENKVETKLSNKAIQNLIKYYSDDYYCIFKLHQYGLLSLKQFRLLIKIPFEK
tara:strand:+ start:1696 stop:2388 length:693 start_codon:yes stop_codon:yes gene_type:complete